ncbi:MAG: hypothetical protein RIE08_08090 [Acidimicrobiales bacterium]
MATRGLTPGPPAPRPTTTRDRLSGWWSLGIVLLVVAFVLFGYGQVNGNRTITGFLAAPALLLITWPIIRSQQKRDLGFDLAGIMFAGLAAKFIGVFVRLWVVEDVYDGNGDSTQYHIIGRSFVDQIRSLDFDLETTRPVPGTGFMQLLTGYIYAVVGSYKFVGFMVFGFFAYLGAFFFYKAFETAIPDGDRKKFAILVFFWPSLLYWPSAIGKEAWVLFGLGIAAYGLARAYTGRRGGFPLLMLGALIAYGPRPHIAILVVTAGAVGLMMSWIFKTEDHVRSASLFSKVLGVIVIVGFGAWLAPQVASFLNVDDVGGSGFTEALDAAEVRTDEGGSSFAAARVESPADYPWAFVTVLFRPLPFEVNNAQSAVSALEGLMLLGLFFVSTRRLLRLPASVMRSPYAAMAVGFVFSFVYVFSTIGNFGILARQRTQVIPFLFVLVSLPLAEEVRIKREEYRKRQAEARMARRKERSIVEHPKLDVVTRGLGPPRKR